MDTNRPLTVKRMPFLFKRLGSRGWRHTTNRALLAVAVVVALGALYQTWASDGAPPFWLSFTFVSRAQSKSPDAGTPSLTPSPNISELYSTTTLNARHNSTGAPHSSVSFQPLQQQDKSDDHRNPIPDPAVYSIPPGGRNESLIVVERNTTEKTGDVGEISELSPGHHASISPFDVSSSNTPFIEDSRNSQFAKQTVDALASTSKQERSCDSLSSNSSCSTGVMDLEIEHSSGRDNGTISSEQEAVAMIRDERTAKASFVLSDGDETIAVKNEMGTMENLNVSTKRLSSSGAVAVADNLPSSPIVSNTSTSGNIVSSPLSSPLLEKPGRTMEIERDRHAAKDAVAHVSPREDFHLHRPLYHNITTFTKCYALMEKLFRIYIYQEGTPPLVHAGPLRGIYASEGRFIHAMRHSSQFLTNNPQEAHMFFLPYSVANMVDKLYVPDSRIMLPVSTCVKDYVTLIAARHPFWNRTRGADHFFVSCHDWGPATARSHKELYRNAVNVVCNADLTEGYVLRKDASLPETYLHDLKLPSRVGGPGPEKRPYLAFFAGQMHGRVRPVLLKYWKDKDPDMKIYGVLPPSISKTISYERHMKLSKYCICAMGYEVNSPRIVEAIHFECVPVIIADNFVLPFNDVLNWDEFSVTVQERDIPDLKNILMKIPDKQYRTMQSRLKKVRRHFMWHDPPLKFDIFHMILHSVWIRRLNRLGI